MASTTNWTLLDLHHTFINDVIYVHAITDVPCRLQLCLTRREPDEHKHHTQKRGMDWYVDIKYCFVEYLCHDQLEAGDTLHHNWELAGWEACSPGWFIMRGTMAGQPTPSNTPIFRRHREEGEEPVLVINLGKYGEAETLKGEVKLEEGAGISITRSDEHNALVIAVTGEALTDPWNLNIYDPSLESLDGWTLTGISGSGAVDMTQDVLRLRTGSTDGSVAHIYTGQKGWAHLRHDRASKIRFITSVIDRSIDVERWWTLGDPRIGNSAYGFYSDGVTLYIYARTIGFSRVHNTGINLANHQIYRLEAEYTPEVGVRGYVDGVLKGLLETGLPTSDGRGLSVRMEVATTNGATLYVRRMMSDHRAWTP